MKLEITNNAKVNNRERTSMSQQALVNTLLAEKQPVQAQPIQPAQPVAQPAPVKTWGV